MRRLFGLLVLLTLAVGAAMLLQLSWGNITLWVPPYRIDLSLQAAVIGLFLALVATLIRGPFADPLPDDSRLF